MTRKDRLPCKVDYGDDDDDGDDDDGDDDDDRDQLSPVWDFGCVNNLKPFPLRFLLLLVIAHLVNNNFVLVKGTTESLSVKIKPNIFTSVYQSN